MGAESANMNLVKEIGDFFPLDEEGYVINFTHLDHFPAAWIPLMDAIVELYQKEWGNQLIGVYLRGSWVRGTGVAGISDLDTFALVSQPGIRWQSTSFAEDHLATLQQQFGFSETIERYVASYSPQFLTTNPRLAMMIQTQACIYYGQDIRPALPPYRPGPAMAIHHRWLADDLQAFQEQENSTSEALRAMAKMIIRCGFELVMEQTGQFTADLYPAVSCFVTHYPEQATGMWKILDIFLNPNPKNDADIALLLEIGAWLESKFM